MENKEKDILINDLLVAKNTHNKLRIERQSNIELLRFIAALMVIFWHLGVHEKLGNSWLFVNFQLVTWTPVLIFAFLSGFFLSTSNKNRFLKFLPIVIFYYVMNIIIAYPIVYYEGLQSRISLNSIFILGGRDWWYLWAILIVYLIGPGINYLIKNTNKWLALLSILGIYALFITFFNFETKIFSANSITLLSIVYALGAWWKIHGGMIEKYKKTVLTISITYLLAFQIFNNIFFYINSETYTYYGGPLEIFRLLGALSLILIFKEIKIKSNKVINYLSWLSLPIYLFHYLFEIWFATNFLPLFNINNISLQILLLFLLVAVVVVPVAVLLTTIEFYYVKLINYAVGKIKNIYYSHNENKIKEDITEVI